jgi:hypothetical protein
MASVDPLEDNIRFAKATTVDVLGTGQKVEKKEADFPMLSDPSKETAKAYGVLSERGFANRWTFYIDKNGRIAYIDKAVKPATSAEDMIAKLGELKVPSRGTNSQSGAFYFASQERRALQARLFHSATCERLAAQERRFSLRFGLVRVYNTPLASVRSVRLSTRAS